MARNKLLAYWLAQLTRGSIPPLWSIRGKYGAVGVGGVTLGCVAHYQPKADVLGQIVPTILTQYRNWANPGTWDAYLGTAPAWDPAVGWSFTAALLTYLVTGIIPTTGYSAVVRFSGVTGVTQGLFGCQAAGNSRFTLLPNNSGANVRYGYGVGTNIAPPLLAGTLGLCSGQGYRNGSPDGAIGTTTVPGIAMLIGAYSASGSIGGWITGIITTLDIYNVPLTAADNANLHADYVAWGL